MEQKLLIQVPITLKEEKHEPKLFIIENTEVLKRNIKKWNSFMNKYNNNPYHSCNIIVKSMERYNKLGWKSFCLLMHHNKEIKGIALFKTRKYFKVKFGEFLLNPFSNPDFVVVNNYREIFIEKTVNYLFNNEKLLYINLIMNKCSDNYKPLQKILNKNQFNITTSNCFDQSIILVNKPWCEYKNTRKNKFKKLKQIKNKLNKSGEWYILRYKDHEIDFNAYKKILKIEKNSWKSKYRQSKNLNDHDLAMMWNVSKEILENDKNYSWEIYYLVLNEIPISYLIIVYYKDVAIFIKTSYDDKYRKLSPGKFIIHEGVKDVFNAGHINVIDFLSAIPVTKSWATKTESRTKFIASKIFAIPLIINLLTNGSFLSKSLHKLRKLMNRKNYY